MKIFTGKVTKKKTAKTVVVSIERFFSHPVYKKRVKRTKKYLVHDDFGVEIGQQVQFAATKPISKKKKWKIIK